MRLVSKFAIALFAFGLTASAERAQAIGIVVRGSWSLSIDAADLTGGAGTDLKSAYESNSDQVLIKIQKATPSRSWRVDVRRMDINWHSNFVLSVRRTGSGTGPGTIWGGESYQAVGPTDAEFFWGLGNTINIPIQLRLGGVSVQIPPATYSTTVIYTVVEI